MLSPGKGLGSPTHIFFLATDTNISHFQATFPGRNTFLSLQIKHSFCMEENILIVSHIFVLVFDKLECWQNKVCQEKDNQCGEGSVNCHV